jgi:ribose 5-phosphate isomerase RpiB
LQDLIDQLDQCREREQATLNQGTSGEDGEVEVEFSDVVRPVMESCTKDSISVSVCSCRRGEGVGLTTAAVWAL